jgi:RNA polymerase sigma-70 factor (ECF subfamily)
MSEYSSRLEQHLSPTVRGRVFPATQWELVASAGQGGEAGEAALEELCRLYWYPVYAFLRRHEYARADAEDMTQGFFAKLLTDDSFVAADSEKGKLRTFLLCALQRYMVDRTRHESALKRGAGLVISFDGMDAEERYANEPQDSRDPETLFSRAWAHGLLAAVRTKLRAAFEVSGRAYVFEMLLPFLMWDDEPPSHRELAQRMGCTEAASRIHIMRLRKKFRDLLHDELASTVKSQEEIPGEITWLRSMLSAR